jgi:rhamnose transport system ATP-binding protein
MGLQGSGRSEVARALFGAPPADEGEVRLNGKRILLRRPQDAIQAGIGYVPEDRKTLGLFDDLDVTRNLAISSLGRTTKRGLLSRRMLLRLFSQMQQQVQLKVPGWRASINALSGGNQQKLLISRWLAVQPRVLVMNEPTRGVDVGAKDEIWRLLKGLAREGCSLLIATSDVDELLALADRILVMNGGRLTAEFSRLAVDKQTLIHAAGATQALA